MLFSYPFSLFQTFSAMGCLAIAYCLYHEVAVAYPRRRFAASKGCLPPPHFPTKDHILGLDIFYENFQAMKAHRMLEHSAQRFWTLGKNSAAMKFLGRRIVTTIEPENIKQVLSLGFKEWGIGKQRKKVIEPFLGEGIFTSDGAAWQHSRDMLRPNFVRAQVGDFEMLERHVQYLIEAIPRDGETVDLHVVFLKMTLDIATEFLFGKSTDFLSPEGPDVETKEFIDAFDRVMGVMGAQDRGLLSFLVIMVGIFVPNWTMKKEYKIIHDYVDGLIEKALADKRRQEAEKENLGPVGSSEKKRYIFLHELLNQTADKVKIRSELLNIFIAGRETTAGLLSNVWFELSKCPDVWAKLQREVSALNSEFPTFEQLKDMKYLRGVLNESLRLYPIAPENVRTAEVDTVLPLGGGEDGKAPVFMKRGQMAHWSIYAMHRRKDFYGEDAEEFKPERWIDNEEGKGLRVGWEYLPFSGGPRICIGQQFALAEAQYITVRLMQEFAEIESRDPEPWQEKFAMVCSGLGGCKIALKPRA